MRAAQLGLVVLGLLGYASWTAAEEGESENAVRFADPVRITAGDTLLGQGRYYPSPVLHDLNGDGTLEILVGDLRGAVTVARRAEHAVGVEEPLLGRDGKALKFQNW